MRLPILALLGLAAIGGYASSSPSIGTVSTTKDHYNTNRYDGVNPSPTCESDSARRQVVYYEASNPRCNLIWPSSIDASNYTHAMLAFAVIDPETFAVGMENPDDGEVYRQFLQWPDKVHKGIAISSSTRNAWSVMSSTKTNRTAFIDSLKNFLATWNFTGIEMHWEWLDASDRGGNIADTQNEVDLMHELHEALGKDVSISVVLQAKPEYLKIVPLNKMQDAVDWFTVLDDQLDADSAKIDAALNLLWSANLEPAKINMAVVNRDENTRAPELDLAKKYCLGGTWRWVTNCHGNDAPPQQPGGLDALGPLPVVLRRSPQGIPTDPIVITKSAQGTAILTSVIYSNTPVTSSIAVSSRHIITSVQGSAKPSSVAWNSQPTSQAAPSQWISSVQPPAPPSSAASSRWTSSVQAPAPSSSAAWSSQPSSQSGSSVWIVPPGGISTPWSSGPPASSVIVPGSSVQPSSSSPVAHSSAQGSSQAGSSGLGTTSTVAGSSAAQSSGGAVPSNIPTSAQDGSTPGVIIPIPIVWPTSSTPGSVITAIPVVTSGSYTRGIIPTPTGTLSSHRPLPTSTGCPKECRALEWCKIYCEGWPFPRPIDEQPPHECLLLENIPWCYSWWFGTKDVDGSDGDPDSHSDSDPNCKPNDCVADCASWRIATFLFFKRPTCLCVPKKCDKDGDSDSASDSDKDDPKGVKPKPTSYPKPDKKKCKLLGCGCGWMGLNYGPGCPGTEFELNVPCGIFGCNPCTFFGSCPGADQPSNAVLGYNGYCRGAGCDPCPSELCSRPGCTIAGGCGPKPGPAPTKPSNEPDPDECEDNQRTVITDRFVMCTEGFDVSAIPSTNWGADGSTSSTLITSQCLPLIDATQTICGPAKGFDTTTTKTGTNTLTSDAPACTRAPLSLDDDEGNNNPDDSLFDTSSIFASNSTMFASSTSKGTSSMKPSSSSKTSSSSSASKTSSAAPAPSHTPMDRNGHWKVEISQWMWDDYSEVQWTLYDPNGFEAGGHNTRGNGLEKMTDYIQSINRPFGDSMPFGVDMTVSEPHDRDHTRVNLEIKKKVSGCDYMKGVECRPYMTTEDYIESQPFALQTCEKICSEKGKHSPLKDQVDLWCDDLNKADWQKLFSGWKRHFYCGWKGFD